MFEETNPLLIKIRAVNSANAHANKIYEELSKFFIKHVGEKILKTDGSLLAKFKLPDIKPDIPNLRVYLKDCKYNLLWVVTINGFESHVYIGTINTYNVLEKIYPPCNKRSDYTVEEILENRKQYLIAKKAASEALNKLYEFGEYDN